MLEKIFVKAFSTRIAYWSQFPASFTASSQRWWLFQPLPRQASSQKWYFSTKAKTSWSTAIERHFSFSSSSSSVDSSPFVAALSSNSLSHSLIKSSYVTFSASKEPLCPCLRINSRPFWTAFALSSPILVIMRRGLSEISLAFRRIVVILFLKLFRRLFGGTKYLTSSKFSAHCTFLSPLYIELSFKLPISFPFEGRTVNVHSVLITAYIFMWWESRTL